MGPKGDMRFQFSIKKKLKLEIPLMMTTDGFSDDRLRPLALEYFVTAVITLTVYWLNHEDIYYIDDISFMINPIRSGAMYQHIAHTPAKRNAKRIPATTLLKVGNYKRIPLDNLGTKLSAMICYLSCPK